MGNQHRYRLIMTLYGLKTMTEPPGPALAVVVVGWTPSTTRPDRVARLERTVPMLSHRPGKPTVLAYLGNHPPYPDRA